MEVKKGFLESRLEALRRRVDELRAMEDGDEAEILAELEKALDELEELGRMVEEDRSGG